MFRRAEVPQRSRRSPAGVARGSRGEGPGPPAEAPPGSRRSPAEVAPESRRGRARARCCRTGAGYGVPPWFRRAEVPQKSCRSPAGVVRRSRRDRAGIAPGYFDGFRAVSGVVSYRVFDGKIRRAQLGVVFAGNYLLKKQKRTCRRQVRTGWDGVGRGPDRARTAQVLLLLSAPFAPRTLGRREDGRVAPPLFIRSKISLSKPRGSFDGQVDHRTRGSRECPSKNRGSRTPRHTSKRANRGTNAHISRDCGQQTPRLLSPTGTLRNPNPGFPRPSCARPRAGPPEKDPASPRCPSAATT